MIHFVNFKLERDGQPLSANVAGTNGFPFADLILEEAQMTVSRSTGGPSRARPTTTQTNLLKLMNLRKHVRIFIVLALVAAGKTAFGGTHTWSGAVDGNGSDPANWSSGAAPGIFEITPVILGAFCLLLLFRRYGGLHAWRSFYAVALARARAICPMKCRGLITERSDMKTALLSVLACLGAAVCLRADPVIQFDDLSAGSSTLVPNAYHLLGWNNVYVLNGSTYSGNPSGFQAGVVSGANVIYGGGGTISSITAQTFDFISAYATAAFNDNLQLEAKGYLSGVLIFDQTNTLSAIGPTLIQYNFCGVDEVDLTSSGGTHHAGYSGSGTQFVMDNVNVKTWLPYVPPLIVNGGFETGDLTGWTQYGNTNSTGVVNDPTYIHSGNYGLKIGPGTPGYISQTIPTQVGHTYDVYFWMENELAGVNSWELSYANNYPLFSGTDDTAFGWTDFLTGFRANRLSETLTFEFMNSPSYFGLDDISIVDTSQYIYNGGFESGALDWWSVSGNTNAIGVGSVHRLGTYGAYLGPAGTPGYISQYAGPLAGQPYLASLWLQNPGGGTPNEYHASWTTGPFGGVATTISLVDQTNLPAFGWTNLHYTVIPTGDASTITFGCRNDPSFFYLDEISMWPVPLIQNGSFEFGDFTGWTTSGNFTDTYVNMSYASQGFYGAQVGPVGTLGYLSQTFQTVPGQGYLIHYELYNPQPMTNSEFKVTWNGKVLMDTTNASVGWLPFEFVLPATSTNTTLQFGFRDDPAYLGLDNVSVTPLPAPYIYSITKTNATATVAVENIPEFLYELQYTTNLTQPNWIILPETLAFPTNYPMYMTDTNATDNQRFYRAIMLPGLVF